MSVFVVFVSESLFEYMGVCVPMCVCLSEFDYTLFFYDTVFVSPLSSSEKKDV